MRVDLLVRWSLLSRRIYRITWRNSSTHRTHLLRYWTSTIFKFWQLICRLRIQISLETVYRISIAALKVWLLYSLPHLIVSAFIICELVTVLFHLSSNLLFRIVTQVDDFVSCRRIQCFTTLIHVLISDMLRRLLTFLVYYIWFFTFAEDVLTQFSHVISLGLAILRGSLVSINSLQLLSSLSIVHKFLSNVLIGLILFVCILFLVQNGVVLRIVQISCYDSLWTQIFVAILPLIRNFNFSIVLQRFVNVILISFKIEQTWDLFGHDLIFTANIRIWALILGKMCTCLRQWDISETKCILVVLTWQILSKLIFLLQLMWFIVG